MLLNQTEARYNLNGGTSDACTSYPGISVLTISITVFPAAAPTDSTFSLLPVHHVVTDSSIQARLTGTLINVNLAVDAVKPGQTLTGVHGAQVVAGGSVAAGAGLTLIYFSFTVDSWWRRGKLGGDCRKHWERNLNNDFDNSDDEMKLSYWINVAT